MEQKMKKIKAALCIFMLLSTVCTAQTTYISDVTNLYDWNGMAYQLDESFKSEVAFTIHEEYIEVMLNNTEIIHTWWVLIPECDDAYDCYITDGDKSKICIFHEEKSIVFWTVEDENGQYLKAIELANILIIK